MSVVRHAYAHRREARGSSEESRGELLRFGAVFLFVFQAHGSAVGGAFGVRFPSEYVKVDYEQMAKVPLNPRANISLEAVVMFLDLLELLNVFAKREKLP